MDEDQLSLAIGKRGQNARLTSRLTGWEINIEKDESATSRFEQKVAQAAQALAGSLAITRRTARDPGQGRLHQSGRAARRWT